MYRKMAVLLHPDKTEVTFHIFSHRHSFLLHPDKTEVKFHIIGHRHSFQMVDYRLMGHKKRSSSWARRGATFSKLLENRKCENFDIVRVFDIARVGTWIRSASEVRVLCVFSVCSLSDL